MKTDEQVLLNYMYEKGYTDEDMFDEKTMNGIRRSIEFRVHLLRLGIPDVVIVMGNFADRISEVWSNIIDNMCGILPILKEATLEETNLFDSTEFIPIDFSKRPLIRDQVNDRKPKFITRKIIH